MTPNERVETALRGGKPDCVPVVPIYDMGYLTRIAGRDPRDFMTASSDDHVEMMEKAFLRHEVDGLFVHPGTTDEWQETHRVEKLRDYWMVEDLRTGERYRLLPDGWRAEADGTPIPRAPSHAGISRIQTWRDLETLAPKLVTEADIEASHRFRPLRHLAAKYPDHHFVFQSGSPMVFALGVCGGYVEGLMTMASDRELFRELLARCAAETICRFAPGKKAGGRSTLFTSYYTGADTISPKDYADLVFPYEHRVCKAARDAGLFVLNWFLGDLMPILDKVMELPLDALVLEQGRKGYVIDPVAIRKRVGEKFCLFGFAYENDFCTCNRAGLTHELERQIRGAGRDGAFVAGTPIMPPNADPAAVDFYIRQARRLGRY